MLIRVLWIVVLLLAIAALLIWLVPHVHID